MGCGGSNVAGAKTASTAQKEVPKPACLVFGMPDSGQSVFVKALEKSLHSPDSFKQPPFQFIPVATGRQSRSGWLLEFQSRPVILCSFFFPDLTSGSSVLFSIRTFNWMKSQLGDLKPPHVVGYIKTATDLTNFEQFKSHLEPGNEASTFTEGNQNDVQKYAAIVQKAVGVS
jgi:hypothetical protein